MNFRRQNILARNRSAEGRTFAARQREAGGTLAALLYLGMAVSTWAFSISQVTVLPGNRFGSTNTVSLQVQIVTPSAPAFLYQATSVTLSGNQIQVEIYPDSDMLSVIGSLTETVSLGVLPVGQYEYVVHINPAWPAGWGTRVTNGIFSVEASRRPDVYQFGIATHFTPARVEPGGNLHVRWLVANNGTMGIPEFPPPEEIFGPAIGPWEEAVFLSSNRTNILLGRRTFNGILNPHEAHEFNEVFTIPAGTSPGLYGVRVCSDYVEGDTAGRMAEANEGNNCGSAEFTVKIVEDVSVEPLLAFESQRSLGSNRRLLVLRGEAGRSFRLQASNDLTSWTTVTTVENTYGVVSCLDYPGGARQRFYRAELVQ